MIWEERAPLLLRPNSDLAQGPRRMAHLYADEYVAKGHVTQDQFDSYFKFAVVRNPYDRIVSEYIYRFQKTPFWKTPSARRFLQRSYPTDFSDTARHMMPQTRYVMDAAGQVLVDRIIRFEEMGAEIEALTEQLFGTRRVLPHRNKSTPNPKKQKIHEKIKPLVYAKYRRDLGAFDYPA
jgi:hypothetical protein